MSAEKKVICWGLVEKKNICTYTCNKCQQILENVQLVYTQDTIHCTVSLKEKKH